MNIVQMYKEGRVGYMYPQLPEEVEYLTSQGWKPLSFPEKITQVQEVVQEKRKPGRPKKVE